MTITTINMLCFGGAAGGMLFALWISTKIMFGEDGRYAVPNAFNWIIEHTYGRRRWKAEMEAEGLARRIAWLESCSRQWTELRMQGREPMYSDTLGWVAAADVCPCGYLTECAIWCGNGHADGGWAFATDGTGWQRQEPSCPDRCGRKTPDADFSEFLAADAVFLPLLWDVKGVGGTYER